MTNLDFGVIWCTIIFIVFRLMLVFASINVTIFRDGDSAWSFWPAAATFRIRVRIRRGREVITFNAWRVTRSWPFTKKKQTKQKFSFSCGHQFKERRKFFYLSAFGKWANSIGSSLFICGDLGRGVSLSIWSSIAFIPGFWFNRYGKLLRLLLNTPATCIKNCNLVFCSSFLLLSWFTLGPVEMGRFGWAIVRINWFP